MTAVLVLKLFAIFVTIGIGWVAGRSKPFGGGEAARILSNATFYIFAPALLFRATARVDFATMPWSALAAFFVPVVAWLLVMYVLQRRAAARVASAHDAALAARPSVRTITGSFGNNVQLGIPMATALFGEAGLQLHLSVVSLHGLILLTTLTVLVERDLAHAAARASGQRLALGRTIAMTARNTVIHPVVMPVLAGLTWNLAGLPLPGPVDEVLVMLGTAVVPLCLVAIGLSLSHYGLQGMARPAAGLSVAKLLVQPALVLLVGAGLFGLRGMPLAVIVLAAAMPTGSNALLFAQRYRSEEAVATAAIVISTLAFALSAPLWLSVLALLP